MTSVEKAIEAGAETMEKSLKSTEDGIEDTIEERAEDGAKKALCDICGPHPGLALVRFWQGIVELFLAILVIVLSFAVLVAASVAISDVSIDITGASSSVVEMVNDSRSVSGFMIFVSLLAIVCEITLIVVRFLNFGVVNRFFLVFVIMVVMMVVIVGVFSFSGGIAAAEESEDWQEQIDMWERQGVEIYSRGHRIPRNLAATAAFGILTTVALLVQGVWMIIFLALGWNIHMPTTSVFAGLVGGVEKEVKSVF